MAYETLTRLPGLGATAGARRRDDQQRRRNLRIAIRQLERAELYMVALYSLSLDDPDAEAAVDDLLGRLRSLERYLVQVRSSGSTPSGNSESLQTRR